MKISSNWLKDYITTDLKTERIGELLTDIGLEVEGITPYESIPGGLSGVLVGKVLTCQKHPNADKLNTTTVDVGGGEILSIVCGAPNVAAGQTVAVATVGTTLYGDQGQELVIKEAKIRGEKSQGMLCSEKELSLGEDQSGILVLDPAKYQVGTPLSQYFDLVSDQILEIGLTPNRTDAMSHYGVARDLHAYLTSNALKSQLEKPSKFSLESEGESGISLVVEDSELAPRYLGAVLENVTVEESPEWLQNRLRSIGLAPINNVVDITNYILHSVGQPLHAFDAAKIKKAQVRVGTVPKGTLFTTLDGVERTLQGTEILIKDGENNPLCIAGVFGGKNSGVESSTTTVFLESAYFDPVAVRKAAKVHGLSTDASFRFERGVDPEMVRSALGMAVHLIQEIAGGSLVGSILEADTLSDTGHYVVFRYSMLDQILGVKIHREKVKEILRSLEIVILNEITNGLELQVPAFKADVTREIDVIEEVLRIYGYNKVEAPSKFNFTPHKKEKSTKEQLENYLARMLQGNGFFEVMNNSLTSLKDTPKAVKLLNPLSNELAMMRQSLLEGLLENAAYNSNRKSSDLKFFELGKIYYKEDGYQERKQLALLLTGKENTENWIQKKVVSDFYYLKSYVLLLLEKLTLPLEEEHLEDSRFVQGLQIQAQGKTLARMGQVSTALCKEFDLAQDCFYAELELENLHSLLLETQLKFQTLPKFNVVRRDLALLVDSTTTFGELQKASYSINSPYLRSVGLFDVYEGANLPEGKKSYALNFSLLSEEKTLEEKEIAQVMQQLVALFEKKFTAQLRG